MTEQQATLVASFVLTVAEGKRLIAKGVCALPEVKHALAHGCIVLKGGTTVSAVAEELVGHPLRISGRVVPWGLRSAARRCAHPHLIGIRQGQVVCLDDRVEDVAAGLRPEDVLIVGANLVDPAGGAAMMVGLELGGSISRLLAGAYSEGCAVVVAAGIEKFSPFSVHQAVRKAGRKKLVVTDGMAVGLLPIVGRVVTEVEALGLLFPGLDVVVIGRGGIHGAEGATTFLVEGPEDQVRACWALVGQIKGSGLSGCQDSLETCASHGVYCGRHLGCARCVR